MMEINFGDRHQWCRKDGNHADCEIVLHELENYKSINREIKI